MFAAYPSPFVHESPPDASGKPGRKCQQLLWGDFVRPLGEVAGDWVKVKGRNETGWMRQSDLQEEQLLEINFIDVAQGDGALIVTPDDRFLLVDAGRGRNMLNYLTWRFNLPRENPIRFETSIISHSDEDHCLGFDALFQEPGFTFDAIYHNGIVERAGDPLLGPTRTHNGQTYLTDIIVDDAALRHRLGESTFVARRQYPTMLKAGVDSGRIGKIRALYADDAFLPGYDANSELRIEIVGPLREKVDGQPAMRKLGKDAVTKNGHSIILRLVYRDVKILLGGDLNVPAERYLLEHYTTLDPDADDESTRDAVVAAARPVFEADIAKSCHHGSGDFTELFLRAVNAIGTVVSSGDDENYAHPRPDALGAMGKYGRGVRPLIFSTELARSTREYVRKMAAQMAETERLERRRAEDRSPANAAASPEVAAARHAFGRNVAVYGMINLRTDGHRILLAYKFDQPTRTKEFDIHLLEPDATGALAYVPGG